MKYGVREIVDVTLRANGTMDLGNKRFYKNEPVLYFDTLTSTTLQGQTTTNYAQGGKGNARLMSWSGERTVTFTMTDALISPESMTVLAGAGLIEASKDKPIYQHVVEATDDYKVEGEGDAAVLTVFVDKEPFLPAPAKNGVENENYACVMLTKDGEIVSEPYIVSQAAEDGGVSPDEETGTYGEFKGIDEKTGKYKLLIKSHDCNFGKDLDCHDTDANHKYLATNVAEDAAVANGLIVDYYTPVRSGAKEIQIDAENFGSSFYLEGSTLFRDTNGVDHPAEIVIPNCRIQSGFNFTMASNGDPSTFEYTLDAFPGYTRFDKTHKVFANIQIIEGQTTASDAGEGLHRGQTWHGGKSYAVNANGEVEDNHDN